MLKLKRILVTGGAGFLGSHLCERLVADQHDVICVDNFFTSQKSNIAHLLDKPNFELIRHDITFPLYLEIDEIYNLACPAAPGHYQYDPIQTTKASVSGSINMLGLAKRCRAKILQASTSEVYGDPEVHPQPESQLGNVLCRVVVTCQCLDDFNDWNELTQRVNPLFEWGNKLTSLTPGTIHFNRDREIKVFAHPVKLGMNFAQSRPALEEWNARFALKPFQNNRTKVIFFDQVSPKACRRFGVKQCLVK